MLREYEGEIKTETIKRNWQHKAYKMKKNITQHVFVLDTLIKLSVVSSIKLERANAFFYFVCVYRRLYVKKCGELYDEKVSADMERVVRVSSAKEVMHVSSHNKQNENSGKITDDLSFYNIYMIYEL